MTDHHHQHEHPVSGHSHTHDHHTGHGDHHHGHHHGAGHVHAPASFGRAFAVGIGLNVGFVILEAVYGYLANSMALLADAGHNLSDVFGLVLAWAAIHMGSKPPSQRFTYGLGGFTVLAALFNALLVLLAAGAIAWEAFRRFHDPQPVAGMTVMIVAAVGIVINTATALMFMRGQDDINIKGAFLHMAADAAVSAGVVIAGITILLTGKQWIDPAISLLIVAVIVWSTWDLLRESVIMVLAAVPRNVDAHAVRAFLAERPGVASLHDLHIWPMSTTQTALTCHLVIPSGHPGDSFIADTCTSLRERFFIAHATLQIETDPDGHCHLAPDNVV